MAEQTQVVSHNKVHILDCNCVYTLLPLKETKKKVQDLGNSVVQLTVDPQPPL